jgi:hypothetical protein
LAIPSRTERRRGTAGSEYRDRHFLNPAAMKIPRAEAGVRAARAEMGRPVMMAPVTEILSLAALVTEVGRRRTTARDLCAGL